MWECLHKNGTSTSNGKLRCPTPCSVSDTVINTHSDNVLFSKASLCSGLHVQVGRPSRSSKQVFIVNSDVIDAGANEIVVSRFRSFKRTTHFCSTQWVSDVFNVYNAPSVICLSDNLLILIILITT